MMVLYTGDTAGGIQVYLIVKVQRLLVDGVTLFG